MALTNTAVNTNVIKKAILLIISSLFNWAKILLNLGLCKFLKDFYSYLKNFVYVCRNNKIYELWKKMKRWQQDCPTTHLGN